jgi:hypothetical protein
MACENHGAAQYINTGGTEFKELKMNTRSRPLHCGFETLRRSGSALRTSFNGFGTAANEQMTAAGYARSARPANIYADFIQR